MSILRNCREVLVMVCW